LCDNLSFNGYKKAKKKSWIGLNRHLKNKPAWRQTQGTGRQNKHRKPLREGPYRKTPYQVSIITYMSNSRLQMVSWIVKGPVPLYTKIRGCGDPHFFHRPFDKCVSEASHLNHHPTRKHSFSPLPHYTEEWDITIYGFCSRLSGSYHKAHVWNHKVKVKTVVCKTFFLCSMLVYID